MRLFQTDSRVFHTLNGALLFALVFSTIAPLASAAERRSGSALPAFVTSAVTMPVAAIPAEPLSNDEVSVQQSTHTVQRQAGGPGQPESSGFSLNTTDGMVDQFTGDFSYSIPLMDVEGYPITISYNSNVGMMDEASWVGLGWNLNVGSVAREMRGIPDEFDGNQKISRTYSVLPDNIYDGQKSGVIGGVSAGAPFKKNLLIKAGTDITLLFGTYENTYTGFSKTFDFNFSQSVSVAKAKKDEPMYGGGISRGFGYSSDSKNGIGRSSSIGVIGVYGDDSKGISGNLGLSFGSNYHSRAGLTQRSINGNASFSKTASYKGDKITGEYSLGASPFGATFTVGAPTSVPRIEMASTGSSSQFAYDATMSYTQGIPGVDDARLTFTAGIENQSYHSEQELTYSDATNKIQLNPAFGYFHSAARNSYTGTDLPVMDFNRERDGELSYETKNLAFSFPTYDVFYVNGMGMSATFRGQRNDAGVYHDGGATGRTDGSGENVSAGLEITPLFTTTLSVSTGFVYTDQKNKAESGKWKNDEERFVFGSDDNVYFKGIGEPTPKHTALFDHLQAERPTYLKLGTIEGSNPTITKGNVIVDGFGEHTLVPATMTAAQAPDTRANSYRPLLASDMGATDANNRVYPMNIFTAAPGTAFTRIDGTTHLGAHISGIEVLTSGGMTYSYALPVYSLSQSEVVFSSGAEYASANGLATYTVGVDNSVNNERGRAHLYDKTTVPAYATSFLLTGVTSSDYVDLTGNGYSIDDIGDYYKINYSRPYSAADPFKWRFPANEGMAFFNEGLLATNLDDMATYTYGEKEIWYTHSVESKNLVAEFTLLPREDIVGVDSEDGGVNPAKPLQYLSKITLYNRSERITQGGAAKPLQVVEFIYDYSLCPGVPTSVNGGGKLTLKEIRFYSGPKSEETALHPYKFIYTDGTTDPENNPPFNYEASDRWGNYTSANSTNRPIELYPYAEQDVNTADKNVKAWKLKKIELPMGSELEVTYEADSYRYVQNQRAMKHLDIKGYTDAFTFAYLMNTQTSWNGTTGVTEELTRNLGVSDLGTLTGLSGAQITARNALYTTRLLARDLEVTADKALYTQYNQLPCNIVVFKLDQSITASTKQEADQLFRDTYLKPDPAYDGYIKELYLRNFARVKENGPYELVPTFAKISTQALNLDVPGYNTISTTGVMPPNGGVYEYGYIILENVLSIEQGDKVLPIAMSPVQKTALEFARLHLTDIVYGSCATCDGELSIDRKAFWRHGDVYRVMAAAGYMDKISLVNPSQVRLYDHDNKKLGGNARVKSIKIRDNWNAISGESGTEYYWYYDYDRSGYGVAAYEPMSGNDENPLYAWDRYTNRAVSFPDESRFTVKPIGESVFPGPVVGYRRVEVRLSGNKVSSNTNLGRSVAEFLTAYEYPSTSQSTDIQKVDAGKTTVFKTEIDLYGLSQGHSIVTNNFHGQPSDYRVYNAQGDLQARTTYNYKAPGSTIQMLDRHGNLTNEKVAMECDLYADARFVTSMAEMTSVGLSLSFPLAPIASFIPNGFSPVFDKSLRKTGFYTHTLNKHIHYSAIVESVETETMGSINTARDLVYDKSTGVALLSSLTDEYNDELFSFSYPAHWYYTLLRNPLEQPTAPIPGLMSNGMFGALLSGSLKDRLTVGDRVNLDNGTITELLVLSVSGSTAQLILPTGNAPTTLNGGCTITVIESGRKNMLTAMMQNVVTKRNPVNGSSFTFPVNDILSASAMTLRPRVNVLCRQYGGSQPISVVQNSVINPFEYGLLNNLVTQYNLAPQLERDATQTQGVRFNGAYVGYKPYYTIASNGDWVHYGETGYTLGDGKWRSMGEYTVLDEYGRPIESEDQLDVPSAVLYGYNRYNKLIPVAQAVNARQHEIAYDSFDDYSYMQGDNLPNDVKGHFDFTEALLANPKEVMLSGIRHSGLKGLQVNSGVTASVNHRVLAAPACAVNSFSGDEYVVDPCMCVQRFEPIAGTEYVISLWVRGKAINTAGNYTDSYVTLKFSTSGSTQSFTYYPKGQTIDGWQRIEEVFTIPDIATDISVELVNGASAENPVYFDDIRIHPFLAGMTTTVYDPETLLPLATHDGYNYTTFYGYDENLAPVRVRVETINGIQTVSESEGSSIPKFKN